MKSSRRSTPPAGEPAAAAKSLVVGTAGHIDHGKTELVRALTGVDTDRLKEEKERGITIDLGFADLDLDGGLHLAFVDVPGHERFVRNMLAGAGGIDLVLLVIAADESVRPQTREHFDICRLLGIDRGVVALTKIDLADPDLVELVRVEVSEFLAGTFLASAPVVPVSARSGAGIDDLLAALRRVAAGTPARPATGTPRLPVDRAFTIRGFGTVVTGTLLGGRFRSGEEVELLPSGRRARLRTLQVHRRGVDSARAGQRTAVNLHGVEVGEVSRGDVIAPAGVLRPGRMFDIRVELLPDAPAPLRNLARVRFHQGTAEAMGRVKLLDGPELAPGEAGYAQIRLERPLAALHGDRFILRRYSPPATIGGGRVLDNAPVKHRGFPAAARRRLERLDAGDEAALLLEWIAARPAGTGTAAAARRLTGGDEAEIGKLLESLAAGGKLRRLATRPPCYVPPERYDEMGHAVLKLLARYHRDNPLSPGLSKEEIRTRLFARTGADLFRCFLQDLLDAGKIRFERDVVCLAAHRVTLDAGESELERALEEEFRGGALTPPTLREVVARRGLDPRKAEKIFHLLLGRGRLVRLDGGLVFHREALEELKTILWNYRRRSDRIDVGAFKELTGTTRKSAIPLLEHLDRTRVTRREGNVRVILPRG